MIRLLFLFGFLNCFTSFAQLPTNGFLTGKTTGTLPYLEYGLGDDRLGGAKMTFLDTGIVMKVVDSVNADYKVQLSKNRFAWLPKRNFLADTSLKIQPYYLTASWKVAGDEKYDYVMLSLDEKLPYQSLQQINPSKIVVDVFGATGNTNWITQLASVKEVTNVYHEQTGDDVFRIIIELKHRQHWGHHIYYEGKRLVIKIRRQPSDLRLKKLKIAVDAGHGGDNKGASGKTSGILEKDYTLMMAKELQKELRKKKAAIFMTRDKDTSLSMPERIAMLKNEDPDLLVSIHLNSSGRETVKGTSTYYRYIGFRPPTQFILNRMLELGLDNFGNIGSFNFSLSGPTEYPNCLVEVAFLSNEEDEKRIVDPKFHKQVAAKIVLGIRDWLKSL